MSMTDIVSNLDLDVFPIIGLILFGVAFTMVLISVIKRSGSSCDEAAHLPLEDDTTTTQSESHTHRVAGVNHG